MRPLPLPMVVTIALAAVLCALGALCRAAYLWFSYLLIGYGYRLYLAVLWSVSFVLTGTIIFRRIDEAYFSKIPIGFAYSFDMFIPLIKLRPKHYELDVRSRVRYYLYIHKVAGWVLSFFIIAALAGLTK